VVPLLVSTFLKPFHIFITGGVAPASIAGIVVIHVFFFY
jgi:hypothetical protein